LSLAQGLEEEQGSQSPMELKRKSRNVSAIRMFFETEQSTSGIISNPKKHSSLVSQSMSTTQPNFRKTLNTVSKHQHVLPSLPTGGL
jgi:hypothetical protein